MVVFWQQVADRARLLETKNTLWITTSLFSSGIAMWEQVWDLDHQALSWWSSNSPVLHITSKRVLWQTDVAEYFSGEQLLFWDQQNYFKNWIFSEFLIFSASFHKTIENMHPYASCSIHTASVPLKTWVKTQEWRIYTWNNLSHHLLWFPVTQRRWKYHCLESGGWQWLRAEFVWQNDGRQWQSCTVSGSPAFRWHQRKIRKLQLHTMQQLKPTWIFTK